MPEIYVYVCGTSVSVPTVCVGVFTSYVDDGAKLMGLSYSIPIRSQVCLKICCIIPINIVSKI